MSKIQVIPKPLRLTPNSGTFPLQAETPIIHDPTNSANAQYLQARLITALKYKPPTQKISGEPQGRGIYLLSEDQTDALSGHLGQEGYRLTVTADKIEVRASTPQGVFYGIQSFLQMIASSQTAGEQHLPCLEIEDRPRFPWRGYMLDEARHFQGIDTVKALLDEMAHLKLNRFHWHLTDDQGWRIEIKEYPRLTKIGGKRPGTVTKNPYTSKTHNQIPHEGWYTQEQIREVVAYAAERHIMVVPEIEMPGHSSAALAAYPQYSCRGKPVDVQSGFGIFPDIYCAGKESTYTFLENILKEVVDLFPGPYIHIGGDEAPKTRWKACPHCQQKIADQGLENEHGLQVYLTNRIAEFLKPSGKRIIFWSDSFSAGLDPSAIVHYWVRHRKMIARELETGRQMINSTYLSTYLDHTYRLIPLKKAYQFEPHFSNLSAEAAGNIMGLEGLMWAEWLPTRKRLDYQTFPRLAALAEVGWTQKNQRSYRDFIKRLPVYLSHLRQAGFSPATLKQANPPWYRRILPQRTIAQAKTSTAKEN
jgi:hexosaminidase